jgi:RecB family exonuclease
VSSETSAGAWSFSRMKAFETCPKQFYHVHVRKEFPFRETEATRYGTEFHAAAENYIRDGTPVPERFAFARPTLEALNAKPGTKHCEVKMGLTEALEPCDFNAPDVWFRGIVDLVIVDGDRAFIVDYKTGKSARYADTGQLQLMALAVFAHFPEVRRATGALLFVIAEKFVPAVYAATDRSVLWAPWIKKYARLQKAYDTDVWNPSPTGLCRAHCPVVQCLHNGQNR